jgi:hypothetical protein
MYQIHNTYVIWSLFGHKIAALYVVRIVNVQHDAESEFHYEIRQRVLSDSHKGNSITLCTLRYGLMQESCLPCEWVM